MEGKKRREEKGGERERERKQLESAECRVQSK